MADPKTIERMHAILALRERGATEGERKAANAALQRLLTKHGLKEADLFPPQPRSDAQPVKHGPQPGQRVRTPFGDGVLQPDGTVVLDAPAGWGWGWSWGTSTGTGATTTASFWT